MFLRPGHPRLLVVLTVFWTVILLYFSLIPSPPHVTGPLGWDKLQHAVFLGFLAYLICRLSISLGIPLKTCCFMGFISAAVLGGLIELLQGAFTTQRQPDINDFIADCAGASVVMLLKFFHMTLRGKK